MEQRESSFMKKSTFFFPNKENEESSIFTDKFN